jgi:hypothetical protein
VSGSRLLHNFNFHCHWWSISNIVISLVGWTVYGSRVRDSPKLPHRLWGQLNLLSRFFGGKAADTWGCLPISVWVKLYFLSPYMLLWHVQEHLPNVNIFFLRGGIKKFPYYHTDQNVLTWFKIGQRPLQNSPLVQWHTDPSAVATVGTRAGSPGLEVYQGRSAIPTESPPLCQNGDL